MCGKQLPQCIWLSILSIFMLAAQISGGASDNQLRRQQQQSGVGWAMQAMQALTGGVRVTSVRETGTVTRTSGGDREQGSITLESSGLMTSRVSLSLPGGTVSETRTWQNGTHAGTWIGFDGVPHPMTGHNCGTDAVWFFPALSLLADYADPNLVFADLGEVPYQSGSVEHIQLYRTATGLSQDELQILAQMSTVDFYIDSRTYLPVAMAFAIHADGNFSVNIPVMVVYTGYRAVNGVQVPFQVNKDINGSRLLQILITNASLTH
jgi:hypothetical protein